jgi:hypothetical protein
MLARKKNGGLNFQVYKCQFSQVYLKTTESKTDEKYATGNRKCFGNPVGKFLNFKIPLTLFVMVYGGTGGTCSLQNFLSVPF